MKILLSILLTISIIGCQSNAKPTNITGNELFPIVENGLWGYVNKAGVVVIQLRFKAAGQFSEGLAPARLNGTYGFIDRSGEFILPPRYDMAYPFEQGQAKVYLDGKPYFINTDGQLMFEHDFEEILGFDAHGFSIVRTRGNKAGVINRQGEMVVDTLYKSINPFSDGLAIVSRQKPRQKQEEEEPAVEQGVVNTRGEVVVPFGEYQGISEYRDGVALVDLNIAHRTGKEDHQGVIDTAGNLKFIVPHKKWRFAYGYKAFSEGLASVRILTVDPDTIREWSSSDRYEYQGVINTQGELVFSHESWDEITPFHYNRAFVKDKNEDWYLINRKGKVLNREPYQKILYNRYSSEADLIFEDGVEFVLTQSGWGAIDTSGHFVVAPKKLDEEYSDFYRMGNCLIFSEDISLDDDNFDYRYGFWNTQTGTVVSPQFHKIGFSGFAGDLVPVLQDGRLGYVDQQGKYIWQEKKKGQQKELALNLDYMNRGYFLASSPPKAELAYFGGWGDSDNSYKKISRSEKFAKGTLSVSVKAGEKAVYGKVYRGTKLYVANLAKDTLYFDSQDSRLYLKLQAKDKHGKWRDIEHLPSSWCGNSYHTLFLPPNHLWEFAIPVYEGEYKTKLRAELLYKKSSRQEKDDILYSNEFDGSVNPGQFWRKQAYTPAGIMDPYNE